MYTFYSQFSTRTDRKCMAKRAGWSKKLLFFALRNSFIQWGINETITKLFWKFEENRTSGRFYFFKQKKNIRNGIHCTVLSRSVPEKARSSRKAWCCDHHNCVTVTDQSLDRPHKGRIKHTYTKNQNSGKSTTTRWNSEAAHGSNFAHKQLQQLSVQLNLVSFMAAGTKRNPQLLCRPWRLPFRKKPWRKLGLLLRQNKHRHLRLKPSSTLYVGETRRPVSKSLATASAMLGGRSNPGLH